MVHVAYPMEEGGDVKWRVATRGLKVVDVVGTMEEGGDCK